MLQAKLSSLPPKLQHQAWQTKPLLHDIDAKWHRQYRRLEKCEISLDWQIDCHFDCLIDFQWQKAHFLRLQVSCLQTVLRYENKQLQCQAWRRLLGTLNAWNCLKLYLRSMTLHLYNKWIVWGFSQAWNECLWRTIPKTSCWEYDLTLFQAQKARRSSYIASKQRTCF